MSENLLKIVEKILYIEPTATKFRINKLLYFIQKYCILEYNKVAFKEELYAWLYGSVIPSIDDMELPKEGINHTLPSYIEDSIITVLDYFKDKDICYLIKRIHKELPYILSIRTRGFNSIIYKDYFKLKMREEDFE